MDCSVVDLDWHIERAVKDWIVLDWNGLDTNLCHHQGSEASSSELCKVRSHALFLRGVGRVQTREDHLVCSLHVEGQSA